MRFAIYRLPLCALLAASALACGSGAQDAPEPRDSGADGAPARPDETPVPPPATPAGPGEPPPHGADGGAGSDGGDGVVRFIAVGDTGKGGDAEQSVGAAMGHKCQIDGCDFVLLLGDNIYETGVASATDPLFDERFEKPFASVSAPFHVALGNDDYGGNGAGNEFNKAQFEIDYSAHSTKWRMPGPYYHFTFKDVELFALDTNSQMYGRDAQQKTDVKRWIGQSTATWKVAFGHHPYLSNGPHGNAGTYDGLPSGFPVFAGNGVKNFAEEVYCGRADLYLSGHDHSRQWPRETCNGTPLAVSGGGAEGTDLAGKNPMEYQSNELGFLYVVIEGKKLTAEFVHMSGTVSFRKTITK